MLMLFAAIVLAGGQLSGSSSVQKAPVVQEALVVGSWTCEKSCPDEDIAFTIEDGKRRYESWLHMRPATVNAEWTLRGSDLTVTRDGKVLYEWQVVKVTKTQLVLRDKNVPAGRKTDDTIMKRIREK
jgi:hypothetical protein